MMNLKTQIVAKSSIVHHLLNIVMRQGYCTLTMPAIYRCLSRSSSAFSNDIFKIPSRCKPILYVASGDGFSQNKHLLQNRQSKLGNTVQQKGHQPIQSEKLAMMKSYNNQTTHPTLKEQKGKTSIQIVIRSPLPTHNIFCPI